jgi:chorismate-pyruvate lyase
MLSVIRTALAALVLLSLAIAARAENGPSPVWRDDYVTRLEALALLQTLNAELLSGDSATLTLDRWCATHKLATPARIVAERVAGPDVAPTPEQRQVLAVGADEPVRFRRVRLKCGDHVLSEAENWYVPARLTPGMNRTLDETDTAFGRVVKPLDFRRRTLSAQLLWSPLPADWEMRAANDNAPPAESDGTLDIPHEVLQHRAVLTLPDGTPISQVVETYTSGVLAFPDPQEPPGGKP